MASILHNPAYAQLLAFLLASVTISSLFLGMRGLFAGREDRIERRIRTTSIRPPADNDELPVVEPSKRPQSSLLDKTLKPVARAATPTDQEQLQGLVAKLSHGGFRSERALFNFLLAKVGICVTFGAAFLLYNARQPQPMDKAALYTIIAMFAGFYGPNAWLSGRIQARHKSLSTALPDTLDLLVTCVEAGLALEAAINRVADEITLASPILAGEFAQATLEMRAGLTRSESFHRLATRTGLPDLKYLASVVVQAELFGTSIAKSLRIMADSMRIRRTQLAEKNAAAASAKMTIPLILCILPSLFAFLLGPGMLRIMRAMMPAMGGQ